MHGERPYLVKDNVILLKKCDPEYDPLSRIKHLGFHETTLEFLDEALARELKNRFQNATEFGLAFGVMLRVKEEDGEHVRPGSTVAGGRELTALLDSGNYHNCAILEDDSLRCWGLNKFGQLGYGHTRNIGETETPGSAGGVPIF